MESSDFPASTGFGSSPLLRQLAIAAAVALLAGLAAFFVASGGDDQYEASARMALTKEVRWPFYDTVRGAQQLELENAGLQAQVEAELGATVDSIEIGIPKSQAFFDVDVVAADPDVAADVANRVAELLVERDFAAIVEAIDAEIATAEAALAEVGDGDDRETATERGAIQANIRNRKLDRENAVGNLVLLDPATQPDAPASSAARDALIIALSVGFLVLMGERLAAGRRP